MTLIPPPRKHRHRYYGVLAPNSPLRDAVTALVHPTEIASPPTMVEPIPPDAAPAEPAHCQAARYVWTLLLARISEVLPWLCPKCGGQMKIIAFITKAAVIQEILNRLGKPTSPPRLMPARGSPLWEIAGVKPDESDPPVQPAPDHEFEQRIAWQGNRGTDVARREQLVPEVTCAANFRRPSDLRHRQRACSGGFSGSFDTNTQIDYD